MRKYGTIALAAILCLIFLCSNLAISVSSSTRASFVELAFADEFDKGMLQPEWEWADPGDDSSKRFGARTGWLEIATTSGNDLWPRANLDAPRLLRTIYGDFAVETRLAPAPDRVPQSGGLLVWKDERNFIRFDRGTWGNDTIILQKREGGLFQHLGDWSFSGNPVYLRLERNKAEIKALYSSNGEAWNECIQFTFQVDDPLKVGMHAVCLGSRIPLTATDFDYFRIFSTGDNKPYKATSARKLSDSELRERQKAEDEKLASRASCVLSRTASERRAARHDTIIDPETGLKFTRRFSHAKLDVIPRPYWLRLSPDDRFIFSPLGPESGPPAWIVPLDEELDPFKPVSESFGAIHGSWSPDMTQFAFASNRTDNLYVLPVSPGTGQPTSPPKILVKGVGRHCISSWSPDGESLAFSWSRDEGSDIWTVPAGGGKPVQITSDPQPERWPIWSPDGRSILFSKARELAGKDTWDVWMIPVESGKAVKLVDDAYGPLSPNGKWLALKRWQEDGFGLLRLSDNHQVHIIPPEEVGGFFDWSRAENKLLFYKPGHKWHSALKLVPLYGGPSIELGRDPELWAYAHNWSPDGKIIITHGKEGFWAIPVTGGNPIKLDMETEPGMDMYPFLPFSPDLKRFAFLSRDKALWIVPFSIDEKRTTGSAVKIADEIKVSGSQYYVSWSPDSKCIAFSSTRGGNADIWMAPVDGGGLERITDEPEDESNPVWSPDGQMIAYSKGKSLWMIPASGGSKTKQIAENGTSPTWSPNSMEIGFLEDNSSYISIMDLATSSVRRIVDLKSSGLKDDDLPGECWPLAWSPGGDHLAFLSYIRGRHQVWVVSPSGGVPTELASDDSGGKYFLYWSPDGKKLSYNSDRNVKTGMGSIWEANIAGLLKEQTTTQGDQ
ncbi:DUF1349 domain-containing protein [Candidatus Poribacteria bacterium]